MLQVVRSGGGLSSWCWLLLLISISGFAAQRLRPACGVETPCACLLVRAAVFTACGMSCVLQGRSARTLSSVGLSTLCQELLGKPLGGCRVSWQGWGRGLARAAR